MDPGVDVGRWIPTQAELRPDKVALRFEDSVFTYRDFSARCAQLAAMLSPELDLAPGARVAYLGVNLPDTLALFFACAMTPRMAAQTRCARKLGPFGNRRIDT